MLTTLEDLVPEILARAAETSRLIVAIAGPPGSGKSTVSASLCAAINLQEPDAAVVVPMDGFHLDNAILDAMDLRKRKGSPATFDVAGFEVLLRRLRETREDVVIPLFERKLDLARAGAGIVKADQRILLVEGNYLLLDQSPWDRLAPYFDLTLFLDVDRLELENRLVQRWLAHGHNVGSAQKRAWSNDIPNAELVLEKSRPADYVVRN
ncbi:nucleoside triphosphate hydrolase [Phyllobacterium endophyticum]|uniref:Nucleoside/nucleotide kinase family protein n=1 Tax=Phyllobacterium endophyticum TaxID=1149773 RepID=A0A2P7ARN1_9HYPH|nr:nucleoside triphosphate hydrolase [Phyllobacterium endophyticum]MBB3236562.1 pantothenate kinase [Phyllobacterium endophyticum]PSH56885.1 nucleoside/nucleotide kinase family protein [Phyllobacterium endophyticum]TYR39562.1 nucleoside triphosphate hydrolase [Phyllobacterium endophyticum]